jgi:hypothetical protein
MSAAKGETKPTQPRRLLIVKRKKASSQKRPAGAGLPSFPKKHATVAQKSSENTTGITGEEESGREVVDPLAQAMSVMPNDTALVIQDLQNNPATCLNIPRTGGGVDLRAVLPMHIHQRLSSSSSAAELAELFNDGTLCQLRSPPGTLLPLTVVLLRTDFAQGLTTDSPVLEECLSWLLRHWPSGTVWAYSTFQVAWKADPKMESVDQVLATLCHGQYLLRQNNPSESAPANYQQWYPTWGRVLQAWEKVRTKIIRQLQRSSYHELSLRSLDDVYAPIQTSLVLDWMDAVAGQVEWIDRPSGRFVRLLD